MSNFLIFKAAFDNSATPAIGTYTAEGATALFNLNASISPDYYLYNTADGTAVQWFVPTAETTDFEFVADILTRQWTNPVTYFIIADSTGTTRLRMWSRYDSWFFENSDSISTSGTEYIGVINPLTSGGFGVFHQFRVRVRKLTASSSSVEVYVDGTLKLTATARAALVTCAKIGFVGGVDTFGPGTGAGVKNAYVYDLSGGDVIDRGVLSGAFNRFISWMKTKFALKSDIPTVNNGTLTIQQNGVNVQTFTANQSTAATANIQCVDLSTAQTVGGNKTFSGNTKFTSAATIEKSTGDVELLIKNSAVDATSVSANTVDDIRFTDSSDRITGSMRISYDTSNGVTAMMYARSYSADGSVSSTNGISIMSNQQTGAARASVSANLLPRSTDTYDLGSSAAQWNNAYIKSLTINGVAAGDILTHNASEFVPRSGGAVLTGNTLSRADDTTYLVIRGGSAYNQGAQLTLYGKGASGYEGYAGLMASDGTNMAQFTLRPNSHATILCTSFRPDGGNPTLGEASYQWGQIYSTNGTISTSDSRLKNSVKDIDDKLLDAWGNIEPKQYKFNDATEKKGEKARYHTGYLAQDIQAECKKQGVNASDYGLFCYDEWEEQEEVSEEVETEKDGKIIKEKRIIQPRREKGDAYALRYEEALVVECKYLRRCIKQLTARIEELEKGKEQEATK